LRGCWLNERRLAFLVEQIGTAGLPPAAAILEIGSGTGWLLRRLATRFPEHRFFGVEPDPTYVEYARRHGQPNETHLVGAAESVGREACPAFHMVLSNDVLHHVQSLDATFDGVAAVTTPGCTWWAIEPNFLNPYTFLRQHFTYGERNFLPYPAVRLAAHNGWQLRERRNIFLIPPFVHEPTPWMRMLEARFENNPVLGGGLCLRLVRR
jgi:2-polyprenyl-3-methyl-5-hydroxy-6-metoxy-1,4-benzoquinol methylase